MDYQPNHKIFLSISVESRTRSGAAGDESYGGERRAASGGAPVTLVAEESGGGPEGRGGP